jgi:hypothetical protein
MKGRLLGKTRHRWRILKWMFSDYIVGGLSIALCGSG